MSFSRLISKRILEVYKQTVIVYINYYFIEKHRWAMDPDEVEFLGEKVSIGIIPNFNFDPIHLISNTIGEYFNILIY